MNFQTIELTVADLFARLTLKRPQWANAINPVMSEELWLATIACEEPPEVRAMLIIGEGRFFSAGGDLGSFAGAGPAIGEQLAKMTYFIHGAFSSAGDEYETQMEREARAIIAAAKGAEGQEGIAAFLAKRGPNFLTLERGK